MDEFEEIAQGMPMYDLVSYEACKERVKERMVWSNETITERVAVALYERVAACPIRIGQHVECTGDFEDCAGRALHNSSHPYDSFIGLVCEDTGDTISVKGWLCSDIAVDAVTV